MKTNARWLAWAVAVSTMVGLPALAAETVWKASVWYGHDPSNEPFEALAQEVAAKTKGQMKIDFTYGGGAKPTDGIDHLKNGTFDTAFICSAYYGDKMPLSTVLDLPMFAPESMGALARVELELGDHPAIQAELQKLNLKMLLPFPLHHSQLIGTRPITKIEDFQGLKIRIPAATGKILEEYGAKTLIMSSGEIGAALKSGAIDSASLPYPTVVALFKTEESSKYVTEKLLLGTQFCFFGVSRKSWDALPPRTQQLISSLRKPAVAKYEQIYAREDAIAIARFREKGLQFLTFNPTDRARMLAKAVVYWHGWVEERKKQGLRASEVFEFSQAKIKEHTR